VTRFRQALVKRVTCWCHLPRGSRFGPYLIPLCNEKAQLRVHVRMPPSHRLEYSDTPRARGQYVINFPEPNAELGLNELNSDCQATVRRARLWRAGCPGQMRTHCGRSEACAGLNCWGKLQCDMFGATEAVAGLQLGG
jgi:hypothetical protein